METLSENDFEQEQDEDSDDISKENKDWRWKLNYKDEKLFWQKNVLTRMITLICVPIVSIIHFESMKKSNDFLNPYYIKCINIKCQTKKI